MKDLVAVLEKGAGRGQKGSEAHEERLRMACVWPQKTEFRDFLGMGKELQLGCW